MCPRGKYPHEEENQVVNQEFAGEEEEPPSSVITDVTSIKPEEILDLIEQSIKF